MAAENWKVMSTEEKKPYVEPYLEERKQFEEDLRVYKESGRAHIWASGGITSAKKPFLIFMDDLKNEGLMEGRSAIQFAKLSSERWQALSEEQKLAYSQQHKDMQRYYLEEMEQRKLEDKERRRLRKNSVTLA